MRVLRRLPYRLVLLSVARPRAVLLVAAVLCAACAWLGVYRLPISTDQNKLFSRDVGFFRDYLDFVAKFPENDSAVVLVEPADPAGPVPPTARWAKLADAIAGRLRGMPGVVRSVHARVSPAALGDAGILFESLAAVPGRRAEVERFLPLVRLWAEPPTVLARALGGASPIQRFVAALRVGTVTGAAGPPGDVAPFAAAVLGSWDRALADPALPLVPGAGLPDLDALGTTSPRDLGYFYLPDETDRSRRVLLVQVHPTENYASLTGLSKSVEAIRAAVADAARAYPEFRAGVTGRPALEADEMRTTDADSTKAELVAMSAVFAGLVLFLRSVRLALAAVLCLGVGIGLTFGWASLAVGELNLLSIVFLIALIGIGMDYFVQFLSRYRVEAARRPSPRRAWVAVVRQVAVPVVTACAGAAGAFLVAVFTPFRGAAELGIIAGGGLLLCLACGFTVLPALLTVWRGRRRPVDGGPPLPVRRGRVGEGVRAAGFGINWPPRCPKTPSPALPREYPGEGVRGGPSAAHRWLTLRRLALPAVWIAALAALLPSALRSRFDFNLLDLQAPDLESVRLVRKLQTWSAVVLAKDLATLDRARAAVAGSPALAGTESVLNARDNADWLRANAGSLRAVRWSDPTPVRPGDLPALAAAVRGLGGLFGGGASNGSAAGGGASESPVTPSRVPASLPSTALPSTARSSGKPATESPGSRAGSPDLLAAASVARACADRIDAEVAAGRADQAAARLSGWQAAFVGQLRSLLAQFDPPHPPPGSPAAAAGLPVDPAALPPELRNHLVSADRTYALYLYPAEDLWRREPLGRFVTDVEQRVAAANAAAAPAAGVAPIPAATGIAVNIFHSTARVRQAFLRATAYALGLILALVFLDLRRVGQTLAAVSVLALGLPMLAGLMGAFGVAWNLANFFGLPILIGAGHEYGVFMVHRYREARRDPARRGWRGWDASDWGLLLCAYVTSASFGFFWLFARHQGLKSLGLVMAVGTACVYLAAVAVLRPVLKLRLARRAGAAGS